MKMQRILFLTILLAGCSFVLQAQEQEQPTDSIPPAPYIDLFTLLSMHNYDGHAVNLHQSPLIKQLVDQHILRNSTKKTSGFRVRIFFDNAQTARQRIVEIEARFKELYPDVPAYSSYEDLYFKVTVGDFRTRTDAMRFFNSIRRHYPGAFIVRENINFPSL